jgi:hypothetical protein
MKLLKQRQWLPRVTQAIGLPDPQNRFNHLDDGGVFTMQYCMLSAAEAQNIQSPGFAPDCRSHKHISKRDAHQAEADGKVRFVSPRTVVAVDSLLLREDWYDAAVNRDDCYLSTARSGAVQTTQLVNFMPRGMKHKVRNIAAHGAHGRVNECQSRQCSITDEEESCRSGARR